MASALPARSKAPFRLAGGLRRFAGALDVMIASVAGLIILPVIFGVLAPRDVKLGGGLSLLDLIWLVLAAVVAGFLIRGRGRLGPDLAKAASGVVSSVSATADPNGVDLPGRGAALARGLLDLVLLLVIQADLRPPLIGLLSDLAPRAVVDGIYIVVVVGVALLLLVRLRQIGHPLAERLTWLGLDQLVPTAGFAGTSATTTFATRLAATTRSRQLSSVGVGADRSNQSSDPVAPTIAAEPTVLAPVAETRPAPAELLATLPAPAAEANLVVVPETGRSPQIREADAPELETVGFMSSDSSQTQPVGLTREDAAAAKSPGEVEQEVQP